MTTYLLTATRSYFSSYTGLSSTCWKGIVLNFIESTFIGVYYFLSLYFVNELHFTVATAGVIISCYGVGTILGGLVGGKLSDKMSPGLVSIGSLFILAVGFLLLVKLRAVYLLMLTLFIIGLACYAFNTASCVWVLGQCGNNEPSRLKAINILSTASNLGLGLSAVIISALAGYGFSTILLFSGVFLLVAAIYSITLERKAPTTVTSSVCKLDNQQASVTAVSRDKNKIIYLLILGCVFLVGLIIAQLSSTYSLYIEYQFPQFGANGMGILFSLNSLLVVLFATPLGNYIGKFNKMLTVGTGAFLLGFGMLILNFAFIFSMAMISCVIYTTGEILFFSLAQLLCYQKGGEEKKGRNMGIFRMVFASSRVLGPAGGSYIYQHVGGSMVWYICGVIGVFCFIVCSYFKKYE